MFWSGHHSKIYFLTFRFKNALLFCLLWPMLQWKWNKNIWQHSLWINPDLSRGGGKKNKLNLKSYIWWFISSSIINLEAANGANLSENPSFNLLLRDAALSVYYVLNDGNHKSRVIGVCSRWRLFDIDFLKSFFVLHGLRLLLAWSRSKLICCSSLSWI